MTKKDYADSDQLKRMQEELSELLKQTDNQTRTYQDNKSTEANGNKQVERAAKTTENEVTQKSLPQVNSQAQNTEGTIAKQLKDLHQQMRHYQLHQKATTQTIQAVPSRGADVVSRNEVLVVSKLGKHYNGLRVFEDLSFSVNAGDILGVVGENAAGKSTLFKCITGLTPHTFGSIQIGDTNYSAGRKKVSALWVENGFDGFITTRENFKFYSELYGTNYDQKAVKSELTELGLPHGVLDKSYKHLSTGQRRKCAIIRTILKPRSILYMLDEPTAGLDYSSQSAFHNRVKRHVRQVPGIAYMLITHMVTDLENLCNKILVLERGKIAAYMSIQKLRKVYLRGFIITMLIQNDPAIAEIVMRVLKNVQGCQYVVKQNAETKLIPIYVRFLAPISQFNQIDQHLAKYIIQKTVKVLDMAAFLDLVVAGIIFRETDDESFASTEES